MKEKLQELVSLLTQQESFLQINAQELGRQLGLSRNWISQYLNELYNDGVVLKINTRPVLFLDRETMERQAGCTIQKQLYSSLEELREEVNGKEKKDFQKLIGERESLKDLVDKCKASLSYPPNGLPVLLCGPTGSGKSYIVRLLYEYGVNHGFISSTASFVHVNCSEYTNNPELLTANLFGFKKGAFTGADSDHEGYIKAAENGFLFLDEVHCLKAECQEKLFLFMDHGEYRMLGDSKHVYHSNVRLAFATTEDPSKVLLKTLLRRIPVRIDVPSLDERGIQDKAMLIASYLKQESINIQRHIFISNAAYHILLQTHYSGNVGDLKNVIQTSCMKALFHYKKNKNELEIHSYDLPDSVAYDNINEAHYVTSDHIQLIPLEKLLKQQEIKNEICNLYDSLLALFVSLQNNAINMEKFLQKVSDATESYYNILVFKMPKQENLKSSFIDRLANKILDMVISRYGIHISNNDSKIICYMVEQYTKNMIANVDYEQGHQKEIEEFTALIQKKYTREYMIAKEIAKNLSMNLDTEITEMFTGVISLSLHRYHGHEMNKRIGIIIAHGYATASSIANAVNQLLDAYVFDAIDMPLDTGSEQIIKKLEEYLSIRNEYQDLILLVDMGSLEKIYEGLVSNTNANLAIANNVNTKYALAIGEALCRGYSLSDVFFYAQTYHASTYHIFDRKQKEKIMLCSCATGIGTAEKLKDILLDSLPDSLSLRILTYDYTTLLENKLHSEFFDNYEVICIVGTLNPNIADVPFIPVEELIMHDSFDCLTVHFQELIKEEDMELFRKNILKNFSLTNIIGNLTILNPNKLLEHVAEAIDLLQQELGTSFTYNTCFGLYVHVCCLIERLVTRVGMEEYKKVLQECTMEEQTFIQQMKRAFVLVEKYYKVVIPIEEIDYILMYIKNVQFHTEVTSNDYEE